MLHHPDHQPEPAAPAGSTSLDDGGRSRALHQIRQGAEVTVLHSNAADRKLAEKLASRGIVPGAVITVLKAGSPLLLRIDHSRWAISTEDAAQVLVIENAGAPTPRRRGFRLWRR